MLQGSEHGRASSERTWPIAGHVFRHTGPYRKGDALTRAGTCDLRHSAEGQYVRSLLHASHSPSTLPDGLLCGRHMGLDSWQNYL